jgi:hypothetical protein
VRCLSFRHFPSAFPSAFWPADRRSTRWVKSVTILERASKLAFLDPEESSEYAKAQSAYSVALTTNPCAPPPAPWLDQPKYRCPKDYRETKLALDQFVESMGVDGVFPVDRKRNAEIDGGEEPFISSHTILMVSRTSVMIGNCCPAGWMMDMTSGETMRRCVFASFAFLLGVVVMGQLPIVARIFRQWADVDISIINSQLSTCSCTTSTPSNARTNPRSKARGRASPSSARCRPW